MVNVATAPPLHFRWKYHRGYQLPITYKNPTNANMSARLRNTENQPGCFIYSTPLIGTTFNHPLLNLAVIFKTDRDQSDKSLYRHDIFTGNTCISNGEMKHD